MRTSGRISLRMCCRRPWSTRRFCSPASRSSPPSRAPAPPGWSRPISFPDATRWRGCCRCRSRSRPISSLTFTSTCSTPSARCRRLLRALTGWRSAADYWFPNVRSLPGAIFVIGIVLYPYVYLAARAMFQTQSASMIEVARTLGATRFMLARHVALPLARPALAVGLSLVLLETLNDIGASRISRRAHAHALDLHHLAQPRKPAGRGADRLRDAAGRHCADGARASWPPPPPLRVADAPATHLAAHAARRRRAVSRVRRLRAAGGARLPGAGASISCTKSSPAACWSASTPR